MPTPKTILVVGDQNPDYDIYLHSDADNPPPGTPPTILCASIGGAGISERVLSCVAEHVKASERNLAVRLAKPTAAKHSPVCALWQTTLAGAYCKDDKATVWRTRRSLGLGDVIGTAALAQPQPPATAVDLRRQSECLGDILLIEDNADRFRFNLPEAFLEYLRLKNNPTQWVVLKTHAPVCQGQLWWELAGSPELLDRLLVIVSVNDLRRSDIRVSQGISWERTAEDLIRELKSSSSLEGLRRARHVVVTLHSEGAVWMERTADNTNKFRLIFDPGHMEGEWSEEVSKTAGSYGFHSTFAAAIAARLALDPAGKLEATIEDGIRRGLIAMRTILVLGHGPTKSTTPGHPVAELGDLLSASDLTTFSSNKASPIRWERLNSFAMAEIPSEVKAGSTWRILESSVAAPGGHPLYGKARRVAIFGLNELRNVPYARFGDYFTADRDEIEALRNLKRLIKAYAADKRDTKPLSIAVFGPPGAGKSFGIKEIAKTVVEDKERAFMEFNLSQFRDATDLIGAFHQVRDRVLEGKLTIVFWDEFDSQNYQWLQYLLAPMQDGKFQEGQITHPIGKCIFVFAGATSYTCANFGPPREFVPHKAKTGEIIGDTAEAREKHAQALADFRLKKGPDFISRLHGSLDVLGPNPRQVFVDNQWKDDPSDVCFPVRRAILLRALLGLMTEKRGCDRLNMDPGLLAALLETDHYRYGSRSCEKIVQSLNRRGSAFIFNRSDLPTDEVLEMNLESVSEFKNLLDESRLFQEHAAELAAAVHAAWADVANQENAYRVVFPTLPAEAKGDNYWAVARMPHLLGLVGLRLEKRETGNANLTAPAEAMEAQVVRILESHLALLAEEEHDLWMQVKLANGWTRPKDKPADKAEQARQRQQRQHDCLIPFKELSDGEREKDYRSIRNIPTVAKLAGFRIVPRTLPPR